MPYVSKRHRKNLEQRPAQAQTVDAAVEFLKNFAQTKFDETVEIAIRTGIDPKQTSQAIRGAYSLPHGIGKSVRVIAFCEGEMRKQALEAGAVDAGGEDLAKKIEGGWMDFDVAIAHPAAMRYVGKLGRVLGPQGKMPTPKAGTVTADVQSGVREFAAGKINFRNDAGAIIHAPMGKKSFSKEKLVDNINAFVHHVNTLRPSAAKGIFIRKVVIKTTMSPSVQIESGALAAM
ncbi:MAG: 50S ribosomal protein L1 [Planctomycetota bacterium]